jgi:5-methylcytosine-specific restriction endonuclease McrA
MPSSPNYKRNYAQERRTAIRRGETGVGSKSGDATRHRARRALEKKIGDIPSNMDVDHKKPLKNGGSNSTSNLRVRSQKANRSDGGKSGSRRGKAAGGRKGK